MAAKKKAENGEKYTVDVQTVEAGNIRASVTGAVNGRQVAALVSLDLLPSGAASEIRANARSNTLNQALAEALVDAYLGEGIDPTTTHAGLVTVTR